MRGYAGVVASVGSAGGANEGGSTWVRRDTRSFEQYIGLHASTDPGDLALQVSFS